MNKKELEKIKQKALEEHIPIIMDDTLEVVDKILKEVKPKKILEIRHSSICFRFLPEELNQFHKWRRSNYYWKDEKWRCSRKYD